MKSQVLLDLLRSHALESPIETQQWLPDRNLKQDGAKCVDVIKSHLWRTLLVRMPIHAVVIASRPDPWWKVIFSPRELETDKELLAEVRPWDVMLPALVYEEHVCTSS